MLVAESTAITALCLKMQQHTNTIIQIYNSHNAFKILNWKIRSVKLLYLYYYCKQMSNFYSTKYLLITASQTSDYKCSSSNLTPNWVTLSCTVTQEINLTGLAEYKRKLTLAMKLTPIMKFFLSFCTLHKPDSIGGGGEGDQRLYKERVINTFRFIWSMANVPYGEGMVLFNHHYLSK